MVDNFSLMAYPQVKLCLFKVAKSNTCIRLIFTNSVKDTHEFLLSMHIMVTVYQHVFKYSYWVQLILAQMIALMEFLTVLLEYNKYKSTERI